MALTKARLLKHDFPVHGERSGQIGKKNGTNRNKSGWPLLPTPNRWLRSSFFFLKSGRGTAGKCTGPIWSKWSRGSFVKMTLSELEFSKHSTKMEQDGPFSPLWAEKVHFGLFGSANSAVRTKMITQIHLNSWRIEKCNCMCNFCQLNASWNSNCTCDQRVFHRKCYNSEDSTHPLRTLQHWRINSARG